MTTPGTGNRPLFYLASEGARQLVANRTSYTGEHVVRMPSDQSECSLSCSSRRQHSTAPWVRSPENSQSAPYRPSAQLLTEQKLLQHAVRPASVRVRRQLEDVAVSTAKLARTLKIPGRVEDQASKPPYAAS
jgi:hypothetical protein